MRSFKKASTISKKFKISVYGAPGVGKTILALSFPKPAVIDMERGTDWYGKREVVPGINQATDFFVNSAEHAYEVLDGINEVYMALKKDPNCCGTIVIDPISLFWEGCQTGFLANMRKKKGQDFQPQWHHWKYIKEPFKAAMVKMLNMPIHLVLVGRESDTYNTQKGEIIKSGTKMHSERDTPYVADIHMRMFTKKDPKTGVTRFYSEVEKDRTHLLKKGTVVENCSYQMLQKLKIEAGLGDDGEKAIYGGDPNGAEKDAALFDEPGGVDNGKIDELIEDPDIKKLWHTRLDWAPGKVRAIAAKHNLNTRDLLGKYLANIVRDGNGKQTQGHPQS